MQNTEAEITGAINELTTGTAPSTAGPTSRSRSTRSATDVFDLDGYRRLADAGVTELQAVPWYFTGKDPDDLGNRIDSLAWFADTVITKF